MRAVERVHNMIFECDLVLVQPEITESWWGTKDEYAG